MEEYIDTADPISIKFQGIEMRGINDSQLVARAHPALEEHEVDTKFGLPVRVYVQRGSKSSALVTFHDVGTNHISFLSFFSYPEMRVVLDHFTVYHVCAPGHHNQSRAINSEPPNGENYRLLSRASSISGTGRKDSMDHTSGSSGDVFAVAADQKAHKSAIAYPNMDELAEIIGDVADHFQIKFFLGFGMGAGANVLSRFALRQPTRLLGLFLVNPDDSTTGYYPWTRALWSDIPWLKSGVVTDWLQSWLLDHWFGACTERNLDLEQSLLQLLDELSPPAVAGYIEAYMNRAALGITRPLNSLEPSDSTIKVDTLLVTGEMAPDLCRAMVEMNGNMDPARTQFIAIADATGALMDELPSKLAVLLLNYLRNLGMLVTLTPEKLQKAALERQIEQARLMHGGADSTGVNVRIAGGDEC